MLVVGIFTILPVLAFVAPLWNYTSWFPKVWFARVTVDVRAVPDSGLYATAEKGQVVVVKQESSAGGFYYVGSRPNGERFVWRCDQYAFSFAPGLAYSTHIQFAQGCMERNFAFTDQTSSIVSKPDHAWKPNLAVGARTIAFTTEEGRMVHVEW
ncbi:MAG: hypothetical protein QM757_35825 [Paludibaculum sp.]